MQVSKDGPGENSQQPDSGSDNESDDFSRRVLEQLNKTIEAHDEMFAQFKQRNEELKDLRGLISTG